MILGSTLLSLAFGSGNNELPRIIIRSSVKIRGTSPMDYDSESLHTTALAALLTKAVNVFVIIAIFHSFLYTIKYN